MSKQNWKVFGLSITAAAMLFTAGISAPNQAQIHAESTYNKVAVEETVKQTEQDVTPLEDLELLFGTGVHDLTEEDLNAALALYEELDALYEQAEEKWAELESLIPGASDWEESFDGEPDDDWFEDDWFDGDCETGDCTLDGQSPCTDGECADVQECEEGTCTEPYGDDGWHEEPEMKISATYDVDKDKKLTVNEKGEAFTPDKEKTHKMLWQQALKLIPDAYEPMIKQLEISSDGTDGVLASVAPISEPIKDWVLQLDHKDLMKNGKIDHKSFADTVVHEFGHILTLSANQMQENGRSVGETYETEEGITKEKAYLNQFYQKFWKSMADQVKQLENVEDEEAYMAFFDKYADHFVTEYAATSPEEDIAESFMRFVLDPKPEGNTVADQKVKFFYQFNELVNMRDEIRKGL